MPLTFCPLRRKLREKRVVSGVFCELPCPEAVEIIGLAGWDFTIIDCEHAPITAALLPHMIRAATAAGIPAIVRVASNDAAAIQHALDAGAAGVQIPQIASIESARTAVSASRFHPLGMRGFNPFVRAADFSALPTPDFLARANDDVALILQIESAAGLEAADGILDIAGIDALFIGPYDLSQSLGLPGETSHPRVLAAAERIVKSAGARGVAVGVFTNSEQDARRWVDAGIRYLCLSVDSVFLLNAMRGAVGKLDFHQ
jgi:4-hydroxy-2-oxoheptanedioate aldolase